jgi:voltage-gated potassium channel
VDEQLEPHLPGRPLQKRIQRKGMRPRYAAYLIIASWSAGVVVFGIVERLVDPGTFDNIWLGMWWAIQTVTTVGYGDVVPGSTAGKVIGSVLMLGGLSLFAVVTGAITSAFVAQRQSEGNAADEDPLNRKLDEMTAKLDAMQAEITRLNRSVD